MNQKTSPCCSFCRESGHKINKCVHNAFRQMNRNFRNISYNFYITHDFPFVAFFRYLKSIATLNSSVFGPTFKQFLMNRGCAFVNITLRRLREIFPNIYFKNMFEYYVHAIVKYYLMPEQNWNDYFQEYLLQKNLFNTLLFTSIFAIPIIEKPVLRIIYAIDEDDEENDDHKTEIKCCDICFDNKPKQMFISFNCKHELCKDCCKKVIQKVDTCKCHLCRTPIKDLVVYSKDVEEELVV